MKPFYDIIFSKRDIGGDEKSFLPFQVRGNKVVTERSLPPDFVACIKRKV